MTKTTAKAEREARRAEKRAEKLAEKEAKAKALQAQIDRAAGLLNPPPQLSGWGVVKTRCWQYLHEKLRRHLLIKRPRENRLSELNDALSGIDSRSADRCHETVIEKTL